MSDKESTYSSVGLQVLIGAMLIYILPFLAVVIDEGFLKTFWINRHAPEWTRSVFQTIYHPLIQIVTR